MTPEIASFWRFITSSIDRLLACLEGLDEAELNWKPLDSANSLYVLATHTLGNTEENLLAVLGGQAMQRRREAEFEAEGISAEALQARWGELRERIEASLARLPAEALDQPRNHPRRGQLPGREVLIIVARHTAEHMGQAMLTRDLLESKE